MSDNHDRPPFDWSRGAVRRDTLTSPELFELEQDRIFRRTWCFVGHESQIPNPNDFFASRLGTDRVVLTRDRQGAIHVLLNSCRHKGMRVVRYDEGNTPVFTCPYHAWSYSTDGKIASVPGQLVGVQAYKTAYCGELDKVEWGLVNARAETYKGAVFACWDPDAPSLLEYLGDMRLFLDALLDAQDGSEGGTEVVGGVMKWRIHSNWKPAAENFFGDPLHGVSHRSVEVAGIGPGGAGQSRSGQTTLQQPVPNRLISFPETGHGAFGTEPYDVSPENVDIYPHFVSPVSALDVPPVVDEWYREMAAKRLENLRGRRTVANTLLVGGIFPHMSFHTTFPRTIVVWHPISPTVSEGWRWCVIDSAAPQEVKDLVRHHFMRYSGPAGMTEQDDMENWSYLNEAAGGNVAEDFDFNYQAGLSVERPANGLEGGLASDLLFSELCLRGFWGAWRRHIEADSWKDYAASPLVRDR